MDDEPSRGPLTRLVDAINFRAWQLTGTLYVAAAGVIGFEALLVLLGYLTIWPVGIPAVILLVGGYAVVRERLRRRRHPQH
jgi:hypothetical protein